MRLGYLLPLCCVGMLLAEDQAPVPPATVPAVERVHLGIVPDATAAALDGPVGVVVKEVEPGSTAAFLQLQAGDTITHFNNQPIRNLDDLIAARDASRVGNQATLTILRDGEVLDLAGTLRSQLRPNDIKETLEKAQQLEPIVGRAGLDPMTRAISDLSVALNELPDRLKAASEQFKAIYPDGEFVVQVEIRIRSDRHAGQPITLHYGQPAEGQPVEGQPAEGQPDVAEPPEEPPTAQSEAGGVPEVSTPTEATPTPPVPETLSP